ncbi:hypothetical protein E2C01_003236 [Portunus trituberculatus]|uniref:Uncharacterized protein n=1 Tax=Portunus trituberculatus TaxID=210409 RepID=A0A5B7CM32_PORTR|nr:hypothetical protein [Portunus trituberculatus]
MKSFTLILASLLLVALTVSWAEAVPLPKGTTEDERDEVASSVSEEEGEGEHVEEGDEDSNSEDNNDEGGAGEGEAAEEERDDEEDEEGEVVEGDNNDDNNDDEGAGDGEEKEKEEDGAGEEHVRKKRQFKAQATVHDRPWGRDYSVSSGFHKTFNEGKTSVGFEGFSNWGASGSPNMYSQGNW